MLSRRNVRVKLMQVLYATSRQQQDARHARSLFQKMAKDSFRLYLLHLLTVQRVAEYAKIDEATRKAKLRPTAADKAFTARLAHNPLTASLTGNGTLSDYYGRNAITGMIDADRIQVLYRSFSQTEGYRAYLDAEQPDHLSTLLTLYKWLQKQDLFTTMVEDQFPLWNEDKSLVMGAMKKTLKSLPAEQEGFFLAYENDREAVDEFGKALLNFLYSADAQLTDRITKVLQNWDAERVAAIDMILLKLAVGEFLHFPNIPPTVTLNEYVDISKLYSTPNSKAFINGVLDRLLKQFQGEGLVAE